jgi:citrate synthase
MIAPDGPQLRDIHLPAEPAWWPPAPGWWALAVIALLIIGVAIAFARKYRDVLRRRREVMSELERMAAQYARDADAARLVSGLHQLLRRVARRHDARSTRQRGEAWQRTLARVPLDAATMAQLAELEQHLYRPPTAFDHVATIAAVRRWLQQALRPRRWKPLPAEQADG